jgi:hypothetical protein
VDLTWRFQELQSVQSAESALHCPNDFQYFRVRKGVIEKKEKQSLSGLSLFKQSADSWPLPMCSMAGVLWIGTRCAIASAKLACEAARIACNVCEAARLAARYARFEVCCKNSCYLCNNELFFA